jgi:hypothetical protein
MCLAVGNNNLSDCIDYLRNWFSPVYSYSTFVFENCAMIKGSLLGSSILYNFGQTHLTFHFQTLAFFNFTILNCQVGQIIWPSTRCQLPDHVAPRALSSTGLQLLPLCLVALIPSHVLSFGAGLCLPMTPYFFEPAIWPACLTCLFNQPVQQLHDQPSIQPTSRGGVPGLLACW